MLKLVIDTYKQWRRMKMLGGLFSDGPSFAFIGVGQHSIDNLYPVILNMGVRIKYLYSRQLQVATQAARLFPGCTGISELSVILNDPAIRGVFICLKNEHQLPLVKACLDADKYVFVEKPAVSSYAVLQQLMAHPHADKCMIAFNKRFSPLNRHLKKNIANTYSYQARYITGAYPEGDAIMELFCHPINNVLAFFGPVEQYTLLHHSDANGSLHLQLLVKHRQATGMLELSTCYSWSLFTDTLQCLTPRNVIEITYPGSFRITPLGRQFAGVPFDKIYNSRRQLSESNYTTATPVAGNNPIVQYGYRDEIHYFVTQVQQGKMLHRAAPGTFRDTFRLLDELKQAMG
ncbi:Gfo/Idh/MocA family oxidoreductase [Chitinophaga filiformis]|uniref:Gfo/Idh/MocA family protein n=1 Tax=Chitinophaga filiformis TaxID=104663 RepID=UPI001F1F82A9|nr:Gfo/Idh/MocA family oxidoreductase [Chitinophaga filiformis]MCF6402479.1 Gfo/Idh/MocA family oxidoreductase [Chitinophaga filiformis]